MIHSTSSPLKRVALGAAAGLAGTFALQALRLFSQKAAPSTLPPMRKDPGPFLARQAERALPLRARQAIPDTAEEVAGQALAVSYGVAFGALYALLRPQSPSRSLDGAVLGLAVYAVGYLGWLPALGLADPIWRQPAQASLSTAARHAAYGATTAAAFELLSSNL